MMQLLSLYHFFSSPGALGTGSIIPVPAFLHNKAGTAKKLFPISPYNFSIMKFYTGKSGLFAMTLFIVSLFFCNNGFGQSINFTTPGTYSFIVPDAVNSIDVDIWGAGGGGGDRDGFDGGNGGGGGGYGGGTISVVPGSTITIIVGAGGAGGNGNQQPGIDGENSMLIFPDGTITGEGGSLGLATWDPAETGEEDHLPEQ